MKTAFEIALPKKVEQIIGTLNKNGYEAYAVGGCVRDVLLGREPKDWDITTSALPMQVKALFKRTIDTGIRHGTVTVMLDKEGFEVTTYRIDGEYEDGRHPKEVAFTACLSEDLKRRDFTINAMAYNPTDGLVDLFGGEEDLKNGIIRCVGEARERFAEDALRILRAFRFSAQLDFAIEKGTLAAAEELSGTLEKISAERIYAELSKILISEHPDRLKQAAECGVTKIILPELDTMYATKQNHKAHFGNVGEHSVATVAAAKRKSEYAKDGIFSETEFRILRLAALLHDIGKPECRTTDENGVDHFTQHAQKGEPLAARVLLRLKTDTETLDTVKRLVRWHDYPFCAKEKALRHAVNQIGADLFPLLFALRCADLEAHNEPYRTEGQERMQQSFRLFSELLRRGDCMTLSSLAVNGNDLIALGIPKGKSIGVVLNSLLAEVLDDPAKNNREYLQKRAICPELLRKGEESER